MQFLKTLFWVVIAVLIVLFAGNNWVVVPVKLGDIVVDVKLPVLVVGAFLLGFLPTLIVYRARIWSLHRRLETRLQGPVANGPVPVPPRPVPAANVAERQATDSKAWPAE
jgi:lipopolysaccharide assembly protein A